VCEYWRIGLVKVTASTLCPAVVGLRPKTLRLTHDREKEIAIRTRSL